MITNIEIQQKVVVGFIGKLFAEVSERLNVSESKFAGSNPVFGIGVRKKSERRYSKLS